jgi:hypothetical protein
MNTTRSRGLIRLVAGPVAAAGIIGGALGLAAVANASTAVAIAQPSNGTTVQQQLQKIQSSPPVDVQEMKDMQGRLGILAQQSQQVQALLGDKWITHGPTENPAANQGGSTAGPCGVNYDCK